jgi:hypothetical protein
VGIYALGESPSSGVGQSRFTTSPSLPTWAVGTAVPSGSCSQGSLFSCTNGVNGAVNCINTAQITAALWVCTASGWTVVK